MTSTAISLSAKTRKQLVAARIKGLQGELAAALAVIDEALKSSDSHLDTIYLHLLAAELLHLECRDQDALDVFGEHLLPMIRAAETPVALRIAALLNENEVKSALLHTNSTADFYRLVDEQRFLGLEMADTKTLLQAEDAAAGAKHYDALPLFWGELARTYRQGSWSAYRWASQRFARECIRIGLPLEAAYHAIIAQDTSLAETIGSVLVAQRDPSTIGRTVEKMLASANLVRLFTTACKLTEALADVIADEHIPAIFAWLIPHCERKAENLGEIHALSAAWTALEGIAYRLGPKEADVAVDVAVNHPLWRKSHIQRRSMINVIGTLVDLLPRTRLPQLADEILFAVTTGRNDFDYADALNVLCHLGSKGDSEIQVKVSNVLFPKGGSVDLILTHVARAIGKEIGDSEQWAAVCERMSRNLRLTVQHIPTDGTPQSVVGSYGHFARIDHGSNMQVIVFVTDTAALEAINTHQHLVPKASLHGLLEAVVEMFSNDENLLVSRVSLIAWLIRALPSLETVWLSDVYPTLLQIAEGGFREPSAAPAAADADSPLNRNKIRTGTPADLRGIAFLALANCALRLSESEQAQVRERLDSALTDPNPVVRRSAIIGIRVLGGPLPLPAMLMNVADPDITVSVPAFDVMATRVEKYSAEERRLILIAAERARQSASIELRRSAARLVGALREVKTDNEDASAVAALHDAFRADVSWSVRNAALGWSP